VQFYQLFNALYIVTARTPVVIVTMYKVKSPFTRSFFLRGSPLFILAGEEGVTEGARMHRSEARSVTCE